MIDTFILLAGAILRLFHCRRRLLLENLALRQQLAALKRRYPRPRLATLDKLFWVLARRFWSGWKQTLIVVDPETVVRWHRSGFALYWRVISRASDRQEEDFQRSTGSHLPYGDREPYLGRAADSRCLMLGFDVSERTISRSMRKVPRNPEPAKRWLTFLRNHREAIAAMDFFTVPTITFSVFYCLFIIS